jgi:hypothetical protein
MMVDCLRARAVRAILWLLLFAAISRGGATAQPGAGGQRAARRRRELAGGTRVGARTPAARSGLPVERTGERRGHARCHAFARQGLLPLSRPHQVQHRGPARAHGRKRLAAPPATSRRTRLSARPRSTTAPSRPSYIFRRMVPAPNRSDCMRATKAATNRGECAIRRSRKLSPSSCRARTLYRRSGRPMKGRESRASPPAHATK